MLQPQSISVVGNAKSIFEKQNGNIIDSADFVIRFNGGSIVKPKSQGTRTDIFVHSYMQTTKKEFKKLKFIWNTLHMSERNYLYNRLGKKPSNGLVAIQHLLNKWPSAHVMLFGFDWKETPTFYNNDKGDKQEHDYVKEKDYCQRLIKKYGWELY